MESTWAMWNHARIKSMNASHVEESMLLTRGLVAGWFVVEVLGVTPLL